MFSWWGTGGEPDVEYLLTGAGSLILIGGLLFAAAAATRRHRARFDSEGGTES